MDNIYYNLYKTVQKINENLPFKSIDSYIQIDHPSKYYLWKQASLNKQYKNLITDRFISDDIQDRPFIKNGDEYDINYLSNHISIYKNMSDKIYISSDNFNTYTIDKFLSNVNFSLDNVYFQKKDSSNLCIGHSFYSYYETKLNPTIYSVTDNNDLFCSFPAPQPPPDQWGRKPKILDPRVFNMGNMSGGFIDQKRQIIFSDGKESVGFRVFSLIDDYYILNSNGFYKSTDGINFSLISSDLGKVKISKYFLSNGTNVSVYFSQDYSKVYLGLTKDFKNITYIKEIETKFENIDSSYYKNYNSFVFNDIIYFCTPSGVRYTKNMGETWDIYDIKNSISVSLNKDEKLLVYALDGVYLI